MVDVGFELGRGVLSLLAITWQRVSKEDLGRPCAPPVELVSVDIPQAVRAGRDQGHPQDSLCGLRGGGARDVGRCDAGNFGSRLRKTWTELLHTLDRATLSIRAN